MSLNALQYNLMTDLTFCEQNEQFNAQHASFARVTKTKIETYSSKVQPVTQITVSIVLLHAR